MAAEQAEGLNVGPPSDIFSLAAVLGYAAANQGTFGSGTTAATLYCVVTNDLQLWKLLEGREVESGLGEEALEEAGLVLHPPQPGPDQYGQLADVLLDQVGQRPFQV
jgi:hypothetical protein